MKPKFDKGGAVAVPENAPTSELSFADLGLRPELLAALQRRGYESPSPIQAQAIPTLLTSQDLLGRAATGTGKTAAFALPLLDRLGERNGSVRAIVLAPTRELAGQVADAVRDYGVELGTSVACLTGGTPIGPQLGELRARPTIVVGTPGRVIDHLRRGSLDLGSVDAVVLDEADEMLEMGFAEDIETILDATPAERQTVLFSATLPKRIRAIASKHLRDEVTVDVRRPSDDDAPSLVDHRVHVVAKRDKPAALGRILAADPPTAAIVFCKTRTDVDELTVAMNARGVRTEALHGGMDQDQRDRVLGRLRDETATLLIATDVAARGLDIDHLTHVVNVDLPSSSDIYTHRVGRVGRAGRKGVAISFATPRQIDLIGRMARETRFDLEVRPLPTLEEVDDARLRRLVVRLRHQLEVVEPETEDEHLNAIDAVRGRIGPHHSDTDLARAAIALLLEADEVDRTEIRDATPQPRGKGAKNRGPKRNDRGAKGKRSAASDGDRGWVYVGAGRAKGIRPGDLVGAIANETRIPGSDIGPIRITEHHSVVGVPESSVEDVVKRLAGATVKGKKVKTRRWTD